MHHPAPSDEASEHRASDDALADLPNRVLFHDRLERSLEKLRRQPGSIAVLFVDLDQCKIIAEASGQAAADRALREGARRLRASVRGSDTVARLAGDGFAVLCEPAVDQVAAAAVAQRVLNSLARPFDGVAAAISARASIGIRMVVDADDLPHEIARDADAALYHAKRDGRACFRFFDTHTGAAEDAPIDLRERLDAGALMVHYQPVLDTATGAIVAVEALARLRGIDGRTVPPSEFIDAAELSGLIERLGSLVLQQACADVAKIRREHPALRVSVNVSLRQLADATTATVVLGALSDAGLPADALTLEITETTVLSAVPNAPIVIRALADAGVQIALDDFATGHASLELLRIVHADEMKIDRTLVQGVASAGVDHDIVATLIDLAHRRGLRVVAEGVETIEQADALARLGCDQLQGFLYSRPVPYDDLVRLLAQGARSRSSSSTSTAGSRERSPNRSAQS